MVKGDFLKFLGTVALCALVLVLSGCFVQQNGATGNGIVVAATFYPLYDFTKSVVGEKGSVYSIVPSGSEPHDFELNPSDIQKLNGADVFVTMGVEFAEFEDNLISNVNPNVRIIPAGQGIEQFRALEDEHSDSEESAHGGLDPHIWLSPKNAKIMVSNIVTGLSDIDVGNVGYYSSNGSKLLLELDALDSDFRQGLSACKKDVILVSHNAFSYLARDYGFRTIYISGLEPEAEPTPSQIRELVDVARRENIKYVFYEELVDPRVAETIAREVGAETLELSHIEGTSDPSDTYVSLMRQNLGNLRIALECQ